jgi:hypothetical protein
MIQQNEIWVPIVVNIEVFLKKIRFNSVFYNILDSWSVCFVLVSNRIIAGATDETNLKIWSFKKQTI